MRSAPAHDPGPVPSLLLAFALLAPAPATAQGLGLDLSEENPTLVADPSAGSPELRPSLALLAVSALAEGGEPRKAEVARAARLGGALLAAAQLTGWFSTVLTPDEARTALAERAGEVAACESAECLQELAAALGVERVVNIRLEFGAAGPGLRAWSLARGDSEARETVVEPSAAGRGFERRVALAWKPLLEGLSTRLGLLAVRSISPRATVSLGDRVLGVGSVEEPVPAGRHTLKLLENDSLPFETEVVVEPGGSAEVEAKLVPRPRAPEMATAPLSTSQTGTAQLWRRPGLYVAAAGAIALASGIGFGVSAGSIEERAGDADGDGIRDITRAEALTARSHAMLANVLVGVGAAALTGGGLWFFLEPAPTLPRPEGADEPGESGRSAGLIFTAGGAF